MRYRTFGTAGTLSLVLLLLFIPAAGCFPEKQVPQVPLEGRGLTGTQAALLAANGGTEATEQIFIIGTVSITGSEPHTTVLLRPIFRRAGSAAEYALTGELAVEIARQFQQQRIWVLGYQTAEAVGPGFPASLEISAFGPAGPGRQI